ncbi:MAG TPA: nucleotide exchange factor GrpE, partial [Planctomycetota bacterium]
LITITDHMDLGLGSAPARLDDDPEAAPFLLGMRAIRSSLRSVLERFGLQAIHPEPDHEFDPEQHEAVHVETRAELGAPQLETLRPGYRMGRRILRPAQVRLLQPPPGEDSSSGEEE